MSLAIPQVRMEVFRGPPYLFDDNFIKATWTTESGSKSSDGDIITLTISSGDARISRSVSFSTNPYRYAAIKATQLNGTNWKARFKLSGVTKVEKVYTDTGLKEIDLYTEFGNNFSCDEIELEVNGSSGQTVKFDYIAVCKDTVLVPINEDSAFDVTGTLTINLPLLSSGVSGFSCTIPNLGGTYTGKIGDFDKVIVYLYRKGDEVKKVFGGSIHVPGSAGSDAQDFYITVEGMGYAEELNVPPALFTKEYNATGGKTVIQDAVDVSNYISKEFVDQGNFIATTHDFTFSEVVPAAPINEVCSKARTSGGAVGFESFVDAAGNLNVFKRGLYSSPVDLTGKILSYTKKEDVHRVRNKQKVYGATGDSLPSDRDSYTESLTDWTASQGSLSLDGTYKQVGSYSIRCTGNIAQFKLSKSLVVPKESEAKLFVWIWMENGMNASAREIRLLAPDSSNYFKTAIPWYWTDSLWRVQNYPLGEESEDVVWTKVGSPSWYSISAVEFYVNWGAGGGAINVDGLYIYPKLFEASYEDSTSEARYGVRLNEPITDDSLLSNAECLAEAMSVVAFLKDKVVSLSDVEVEGDNRFTSGYLQHVEISNDGINGDFRILEIKHVVKGVDWKTYLTLSDEPIEIDYVFLSFQVRLERIESGKALGVRSFSLVGSKDLLPDLIGDGTQNTTVASAHANITIISDSHTTTVVIATAHSTTTVIATDHSTTTVVATAHGTVTVVATAHGTSVTITDAHGTSTVNQTDHTSVAVIASEEIHKHTVAWYGGTGPISHDSAYLKLYLYDGSTIGYLIPCLVVGGGAGYQAWSSTSTHTHGLTTQPAGHPVSTQSAGHGVSTQPAGHGVDTQPSGHSVSTQPAGHPVSTQPSGHSVSTQPSGHTVTQQPSGHAVTNPPHLHSM
jgi:hypothetical protein